MKTFVAAGVFSILAAAFAVVAVLALTDVSAAGQQAEPAQVVSGASEEVRAVILDLLEGREVECEEILRLLLGLDEGQAIDNEQLARFLLGVDESDEIDTGRLIELVGSLPAG